MTINVPSLSVPQVTIVNVGSSSTNTAGTNTATSGGLFGFLPGTTVSLSYFLSCALAVLLIYLFILLVSDGDALVDGLLRTLRRTGGESTRGK